jgi:predicted phage-related endonuclease
MKRETHEITSRGQWLDLRRRDLTASRISALWDLHGYLSREELGASMLGRFDAGDNSSMRRGRILEPAVAAALAEDHPDWKIEKATTYHRLPELRLGATPDYWFTDEHGVEGLIQIKTAAPEIWDKWHGQIPLAYTLQTLTELLVTGRERGLIGLMITSRSLPVYEYAVPRHPAAEEKILAAAAAWWEAFDSGAIAPAAPTGELETMLDDGSSVDLSADNYLHSALPDRQALKSVISDAEKRVAEIDAHLKAAMGRATYGYLPGWAVTYRAYQRAERLLPAATIRSLRVSAKEEESI